MKRNPAKPKTPYRRRTKRASRKGHRKKHNIFADYFFADIFHFGKCHRFLFAQKRKGNRLCRFEPLLIFFRRRKFFCRGFWRRSFRRRDVRKLIRCHVGRVGSDCILIQFQRKIPKRIPPKTQPLNPTRRIIRRLLSKPSLLLTEFTSISLRRARNITILRPAAG